MQKELRNKPDNVNNMGQNDFQKSLEIFCHQCT